MIWNNNIELVEDCRFCAPPDRNRILYETENFYVMLSLGAFVEGYLLINSKYHEDCCGAFNELLGAEFESLVKKTKDILIEAYGECVCFEHGRAGACLQFSEANQHCYHAHMHCIPVNLKLSAIVNKDFTQITIPNLESLRDEYYIKPAPYLFVDDGTMNMFYITKPIRKQYLRYLTSTGLGLGNGWNWMEYPNYPNINSAKLKLSKLF